MIIYPLYHYVNKNIKKDIQLEYLYKCIDIQLFIVNHYKRKKVYNYDNSVITIEYLLFFKKNNTVVADITKL